MTPHNSGSRDAQTLALAEGNPKIENESKTNVISDL